MDKSRRRFIKAGVGLAILFAGYLAYRQLNIPKISETNDNIPSNGGNNTARDNEGGQGTQEINIDFSGYPRNSPLNHTSPYLVLEPLSISQAPNGTILTLNCHNKGGGPSTAVLEAFRLDESISFPLDVSTLPKISSRVLHLSPGSSTPVSMIVDLPESSIGMFFILSDPVLDTCPRRFSSPDEMESYVRHIVYFGK